jgi:hypothetical protein
MGVAEDPAELHCGLLPQREGLKMLAALEEAVPLGGGSLGRGEGRSGLRRHRGDLPEHLELTPGIGRLPMLGALDPGADRQDLTGGPLGLVESARTRPVGDLLLQILDAPGFVPGEDRRGRCVQQQRGIRAPRRGPGDHRDGCRQAREHGRNRGERGCLTPPGALWERLSGDVRRGGHQTPPSHWLVSSSIGILDHEGDSVDRLDPGSRRE